MNLLITGAWQQAKESFDVLQEMGHEIVFLQQEHDILPCNPAWIEGIICNGLFLHHPIEMFSNLRYIQLTSAGFDRVPMDYIQSHNIEIHNARGVYSIPMAEFAVACVLNLYKELSEFRDQQRTHKWEKRRTIRELFDKSVVIVGCGSVGTECAKRFRALGCHITGVDIAPRDDENYERILPMEELDIAIEIADILVLSVPFTIETEAMINSDRLQKLTGILINLSRGGVVVQQALEDWSGTAVVDVFEHEPLPNESPLWDKDTFIVTPHNSFVGENNSKRLKNLLLYNLKAYEGRKMINKSNENAL